MIPPVIILDIGFMVMLVVVAFSIVRLRSLFAIVMLQGVYSLVSAAWFVSLDAVDVAFTEAAVGAGVSTILMLAAMLLADRESKPVPLNRQVGPLLVVLLAGIAMFYAIGDMPAFGDPNSPANAYVGMDYMERTAKEIHIPNVVTAVLASYRGYDTFGEVVVIFSAGLGVLLLLGLNGNAGMWRAQPNGVRISPAAAPAARSKSAPAPVMTPSTTIDLEVAPDIEPPKAKTLVDKTPAKKGPARKTATKKAAAKKPAIRAKSKQKSTPKKGGTS